MEQKILKTGNSLAVTIPAYFVKMLGLKPGDDVKAKIDMSRSTMSITFSGSGQMTLLPKK